MLKLPFCMEFVIYLTNRCNLRCEMCSQYGEFYKENASADLCYEQWCKFFDTISDVSPKPKVILMGGEPLLYKDFDKIMEYLNKNDFQIHVVTNGVFLDKHLDILSKTQKTSITISIDGLESTHDKIRGFKGTFQKVIDNIQKLNRLKENGATFKILINSVILPDNVKEMDKFLAFMQKQNINQVVFQHLQFLSEEQNKIANDEWKNRLGGEFKNNLITHKKYNIDENYIKEVKKSIQKLNDICEIETFIFPYLTDEEMDKYYLDKDIDTIRPNIRCTTPWLTAFINSDGGVSNCIENSIGNICEDNFWNIWNNKKAEKLRQSICNDGCFSVCHKCCNFYKSSFLYAKNAKIKLHGKTINLPAELNYMNASPQGVFVLDKSLSTQFDTYAVPIEIHSQEMIEKISQKHKILGFFNEIEN